MSRCCEEIHPLLFRVDEGEATPEQAMLVARHLSDCTACRITVAREKRLAEVLGSELDELPVGEDFVDAVMATLPQELPKRKRRTRSKNLRGLKLASFGGLLGFLAWQGLQGLSGDLNLPARVLPLLTSESGPAIPEGIDALARVVATFADALAGGLPSQAEPLAAGLVQTPVFASLVLGLLIAVTGAAAFLAFAVRSLARLG